MKPLHDAVARGAALRAGLRGLTIAACLSFGALPAMAQDAKADPHAELPTVPYVPTPQEVVDKLLDLA